MNESHDDSRDQLLAMAWCDDGKLADWYGALISDRKGVSRWIAASLARTNREFVIIRRRGTPLSDFRWEIRGAQPRQGRGHAVFSDDSRISSLELTDDHEPRLAAEGDSRWERLTTWPATNLPQLIGIGTGLIYLLLRIPVGVYYARFHVTPDQAGYSTVDLLLYQAVPAILIAVAIVAVYAAAALLIYPASAATETARLVDGHRLAARTRLVASVLLAVWVFNFVYMLAFDILFGFPMWSSLLSIGLGIASFVFWAATSAWFHLRRPFKTQVQASRAATLRARRGARGLAVVYGGAAVIGVIVFSVVLAYKQARDVTHGRSVSPAIMPWKGQSVEVDWKTPGAIVRLPSCGVMYLGEANGRQLLFNSRNWTTLRVASSDVALSFPGCRPTTRPATNVTSDSATLHGVVDPYSEATSYFFEYGPEWGYGASKSDEYFVFGSEAHHGLEMPGTVAITLTHLNPSTTYYYRIVTVQRNGQVRGDAAAFRTLAVPKRGIRP